MTLADLVARVPPPARVVRNGHGTRSRRSWASASQPGIARSSKRTARAGSSRERSCSIRDGGSSTSRCGSWAGSWPTRSCMPSRRHIRPSRQRCTTAPGHRQRIGRLRQGGRGRWRTGRVGVLVGRSRCRRVRARGRAVRGPLVEAGEAIACGSHRRVAVRSSLPTVVIRPTVGVSAVTGNVCALRDFAGTPRARSGGPWPAGGNLSGGHAVARCARAPMWARRSRTAH